MDKTVRTLTGDLPPASLGRTLIHEHLCVDWGEMLGRPKVLDFDYISRVFLPRLQREAGVTDEQVSIMLEENPQRALAF